MSKNKYPKRYFDFGSPVDTGRKLSVHKTFRRRPGRLLNALCTFILRPVSTGGAMLKIICILKEG